MLILGLSVSQAIGEALKTRNPALAHALAPWDGEITALYSKAMFASGGKDANRVALHLARQALQQNPIALPAVNVLGFESALQGNKVKARSIFDYAQFLSRRDLQTQLWMVEDSVDRGDIPGALRHYDIALRTSKLAPDLMFPILATAIADPSIMAQLTATLSKKPAWTPNFIEYVARNSNDMLVTAKFFVSLQRAGIEISSGVTAVVVDQLVAQGKYGQAWQYYSEMRPGATLQNSRDPDFTAMLPEPSLFDWKPVNDAVISTSIQKGEGRGGLFNFALPPGTGGIILRQAQMLPPGDYRLDGRSISEQNTGSLPYWTLTCAKGQELGRIVVARNGGSFFGRFKVPIGCSPQTLALVAPASDDIAGVAGQIEQAKLSPY